MKLSKAEEAVFLHNLCLSSCLKLPPWLLLKMDSNLSNRTFRPLWVLLVRATESQTKSVVWKIRKEISIDSIKELSIDSIKCLVIQTTDVSNNVRNKQDGKAAVTEDTVYENEDEAVRDGVCF